MKLHTLSLLAVSAALISGSLTAAAAQNNNSRSISQARAISIAKGHVGGGRVTDVDRSRGRWEIEIRKGCKEYDVDVSSRNGHVIKVETDNHCR